MPVLMVGFVAAFVAYYVLVWNIRGERLGTHPSVFQLLTNPLTVRRGDLTARGQQLHGWLLMTFVAIVGFGVAIFAVGRFLPPSLTHAPS